MDDTAAPNDGVSRRSLLKTAPLIAGLAVSVGTVAALDAAEAQTKLSHEQAKYQDKPHDGQQCSTCVNFIAPASCRIVANPISPQGWCQFYGKKPGG